METNVNAFVGGLILANVATIGSVIWFGVKMVWFAARLTHKVEENEKDINAAWKELRILREKLDA